MPGRELTPVAHAARTARERLSLMEARPGERREQRTGDPVVKGSSDIARQQIAPEGSRPRSVHPAPSPDA
jgi:hypothetical protein